MLEVNGAKPLTQPQIEIIKMLDAIKDQVAAGQVETVGVITVGVNGANVGHGGGNIGGLFVGMELLRGMLMAQLTAPPQQRSAILRPGGRR